MEVECRLVGDWLDDARGWMDIGLGNVGIWSESDWRLDVGCVEGWLGVWLKVGWEVGLVEGCLGCWLEVGWRLA